MRGSRFLKGFIVFWALTGVTVPARPDSLFVRGDANGDRRIDISDPVAVLHHLFWGAVGLSCHDSGDANNDGTLDVSDAVFGLVYLFLGGPPPDSPFPECGSDPTPDELGCAAFPACSENRIVAIRRVNGGIEIELFSPAPFPVRALFPVLCIGDEVSSMQSRQPGGSPNAIIFLLGEEEFALAKDGDLVTIQYGGCRPDFEDLRPGWDLWVFGPLDRSLFREN